VSTDPSDDGSFLVEFFDSRDALRVHSAAYHAYLLEVPVETELHSVLESDVGATKSVVSISGLPNGICTKAMMQAVLEQAGLEDSIVSSEARAGSPCGHFFLTLDSQQAVDRCVEHFHGRRWDASGAVSVRVESRQQPTWTAPVSTVVAPSLSCSEEGTDCGVSDDDLEYFPAPPGLERSSIQACPPRGPKPHKHCSSSRVTASTCSSEPHSDVEFEALAA
jgi:hypothetical protein